MYVPEEAALRAEIRMLCHDDRLAGHLAWKRLSILRSEISTGQRWTTISSGASYGELKPLPVPEDVWQEVSLDFITGLPECRHGDTVFDSILIMVDRFSKMVLYEPAKITWQATDFADAFFSFSDELFLALAPKGHCLGSWIPFHQRILVDAVRSDAYETATEHCLSSTNRRPN